MILIISLSEKCRLLQDFSITVKKRDLINISNKGEASKKPREGSLNTSTSSDIHNDLFTESLKDRVCHNIIEFHKQIEKQIIHIFGNTNKLKEKQIKSKCQLQELRDSVDFITKKFDIYKQERKEREEIIKNLTENIFRFAQ